MKFACSLSFNDQCCTVQPHQGSLQAELQSTVSGLNKAREEVQQLRSQLAAAAEQSIQLKADLSALKTEASNMERKLSAEVSYHGYIDAISGNVLVILEAFMVTYIQHLCIKARWCAPGHQQQPCQG